MFLISAYHISRAKTKLTPTGVRHATTANHCLTVMINARTVEIPRDITKECLWRAQCGHDHLILNESVNPTSLSQLVELGYEVQGRGSGYRISWRHGLLPGSHVLWSE
jgi:hypothetical protein